MTPKEKAKEIITKYYSYLWEKKNIDGANISFMNVAKQCALIAVDEIINQLTPIEKAPNNLSAFNFWQEDKQEIEKL